MSKTIVLADDSVTIQKVVELTFMDEDYRVVAFSNGEEALSNLNGLSPDIVIADIHMPGANGYEVCRRSKSRYPQIPVLLLVGTFEPFDELQAQAAGADAHLKKPFDSGELLRLVDQLIRERTAVTAAPEPEGALEIDAPTSWEMVATAPQTPVSMSAAAMADPVTTPMSLSSVVASLDPVVPVASNGHGNGSGGDPGPLSDVDIDRVARRVVEILSERILREVAWEVIPDLAEVVIKDRLRELESQVE